jgi:hypothetical protein
VGALVDARPSTLVVITAALALVLPSCTRASPCQGSDSCGTIYPAILVISCGGAALVQSSLTGTCSASGFSCDVPDAAPLAECTTASIDPTGPGTCDVELTFANGFVYSGSFTFSEGPQGLVPSPEVVPVFCLTDGGADAQ